MCDKSCLEFVIQHLAEGEIREKSVLEVGSRAVQGPHMSLRPIIEPLGPSSYLGVDIKSGPGVDEICDAGRLRERFGDDSFDIVVSTEMLEHVRDWRRAISNLKHVVRPRGILLLTTRSYGFPYHGWPNDFWRYELEDMETIFSDFEIRVAEPDLEYPGIFLKATKPLRFRERDLSDHRLFSIVKQRRAHSKPLVTSEFSQSCTHR
jgi:SAM-dependent methyltransferase